MAQDEKSAERIREEVDPQSGDPEVVEVEEVAREGQLVGKVDEVAGQLARRMTADSEPQAHEGSDVELPGGPMPAESGRGETIELQADEQRRIRTGDELVVNLPVEGAGEGWTYDVEGDDRSLDIHERAALVLHGDQQGQRPAAGRTYQFVIHAARRGKATLRFERRGRSANGDQIRLRVEVR